jgi:GINS complex subunit 4
MAPELLPFQEKLIHNVSKLIGDQEREVQSTYGSSSDTDDRFYANILKMEIERAKYVLKSYLRVRIAKIEKHLYYIVEKD